jgi:hypothetical protein
VEAYADYTYYTDTYHGEDIPQKDFERLALEASYFLRDATQDRITVVTDDVKMATCAVASVSHRFGEREGIASESEGTYSISYQGGAGRQGEVVSLSARMLAAAKLYLSHTGLLYAGVRRRHDH